MKRTFLALIGLLLTIGLYAAPITREQARQKAIDYLKKTTGTSQLVPISNRAKLAPRRAKATSADQDLYYVFSRGEGKGFVIVSGDDRTLPVIGYTEEGDFDYTQLPDNMRNWLDARESELLELSTRMASEIPVAAAAAHERIEYMVTTKWNQGSPYNDECPNYFNLGRSVTGCVATAMAQVLYYQREKSVTEVQADIPGYTGGTPYNGQNLKVEGIAAGSPIDWANMQNTYSSSSTAKQKKAVAQLMHYCGVSVYMDYTNSSSGAQSSQVPIAFQKYFGYGSKTRIVYQDAFSADGWDKLLYQELAEGRPFYLSGYNVASDGTWYGHAFVCDGYDGNYCYHINWGWGGQSDGWYMITKLNPGSQGIGGSEGGYSTSEAAVIGCEPENYGDKAMTISKTNVKKLCVENWDTNGDGVFSYAEAAAVTDLGTVFKGQGIIEFPELYNFTGLTSIPDDAFAGCNRLTTIKIPKSVKTIGSRAFAGCTKLKSFNMPVGITAIGDSAFAGCKVLPQQEIPASLSRLEANTFEGCQAFTAVTLPINTKYVGSNAFKGCTKLSTVTMRTITPQAIELGDNVFADIDLSEATLNVQQGTGDYLRSAAQWKDFGTIYEQRTLSQGKFATSLETKKKYFIYNVGTGRYMTRGEAWGSQAIVDDTNSPMTFEFRTTAAMPDGVYYLYSTQTGNDANHIFFRTSNDNNVGSGVKACFVDGQSTRIADKTSWWKVALVEGTDNTYTIQVPSGQTGYSAGQYLGIQTDHNSNAASPTYGAYWDVVYEDHMLNCQWMLVPYDEAELRIFQKALELNNLLAIGKSKHADIELEQLVYNNLNSSAEEMDKASRKLRTKLGFLNFIDEAFRAVAIATYDTDHNGEISENEMTLVTSIDTEASQNKEIVDLSDLKKFTFLNTLLGNSFKGCTSLKKVVLPERITNIYYQAFQNDTKLESVEIGSNLYNLGPDVFSGCTSLKEFRIGVPDPATIELGENVFKNVPVANATLYVPYGSKDLYAEAEVWKEFGTIKEMRALEKADNMALTTDCDVYVYNRYLKKSITYGEAYGTQGVVDDYGMAFQLKRNTNMPKDCYYLMMTEPNSFAKKVLFRTDTDTKVGTGIKACFVDGTLSAKAYWKIKPVEGLENVYTLQVPESDASYVEGEYLGTNLYHETNAVYGSTYGIYWDITGEDIPERIQWTFKSLDDQRQKDAFFANAEELKELLSRAQAKGIEANAEQAVYDNFESTQDEITNAIQTLRQKLHYIDFTDAKAKSISTGRWDEDEDGELSLEEAAAVTDLGTAFKSATSIRSFEELHYFTSITTLPDEAFRSCISLMTIYIPKAVTKIGNGTFNGCSKLKYVVVENPDLVVEASGAMLQNTCTAFVPASQLDAYKANETWSALTLTEYTGIPTVTAQPASRIYGRLNPNFTYLVTGAPINGEPTITTDADNYTPVGEYPLVVEAGTITSAGLVLVNGTFTIEPASVTLTARNFTRNIGEENPEFTFTNSSLRNGERLAEILLTQPTLECDATVDSPTGVYEIRISGASAQNYEFQYVNGQLTIIDPTGVDGVDADKDSQRYYDLQGRRVLNPKRGLYIVDGKKKVVK